MQWLIDIVTEWIVTQGYLLHSFVDRGNPAAVDFTTVDFTLDGAFHSLDVSGIVPDSAKAILFNVQVQNSAASRFVWLRSPPNTNNKNIVEIYSQVAGIRLGTDAVLGYDGSGNIEYAVFVAGWLHLSITVKGWWL
jgi:hypothetical protein